MPLMEIDTLGSAIAKYIAIALIAGTIAFYKGCEVGRNMSIDDEIKSSTQSRYSIMYKIEAKDMVPYMVDMSTVKILPKGIEEKLER